MDGGSMVGDKGVALFLGKRVQGLRALFVEPDLACVVGALRVGA